MEEKRTKFKEFLFREARTSKGNSQNRGITLIALVITIIILLILAGIAIATLGGENGLFARVKQGKEKYAISEAKEKIELEISNLQVEQQGKGEELKKEDLIKMNSDEIDVRDTANFPVEVICKNYKFEIDSNFQVTYIGETNETIITYTTQPEEYTNKDSVKVSVKITNPKGIKSILKPGETDKIIPQDRTTVGIDFFVTKNGHYILKVEDLDGNEVSKDIYIGIIDKLEPKTADMVIKNINNGFKITVNSEDADETEEYSKSGIEKYEYYIDNILKQTSTENMYTITGLNLGQQYSIYAVVYDKAGNKKQTETQNVVTKQVINFNNITASDSNTGIDEEGNLYTWGWNIFGALGDGTTNNSNRPIQIIVDSKFEFAFSNGQNSAAIDINGNLYTWGNNSYGELGYGTKESTSHLLPVKLNTSAKFEKVKFGTYSNLIALDDNGNIWTCGNNDNYNLGDGTTEEKLVLTQITNNVKYIEIQPATYGGYAIDEDMHLWVWGYGSYGTGKSAYFKTPTKIMEDTKFKKISANGDCALAIDENDKLWGWGYNYFGGLGNGTSESDEYQFSKISILPEKSFKEISCGVHVNFAIDSEGNLWGCGRNNYYQLLDGTVKDKNKYQIVMNGTKFKKVYTSIESVFAEDESGKIYVWGRNNYGQLGDGTWKDKSKEITPFN